MGERDIAVVLDALGDVRGDLRELRKDLQRLYESGCAKAPAHADAEMRLRSIEKWQQGLTGKITILATIAGVVLSTGVKWLWAKVAP